jgi:regulator of sirC expression with transglutaminase-like and TPR domain
MLFRHPAGFAAGPAAPPPSELEKIMALPDEEFQKASLARINLLVSKEIEPSVDVDKYMVQFNELVDQVKQANQKYQAGSDPDKLIRVLNTYLYFEKKFRYAKLGDAKDASLLAADPKNLFLYGILDRMQGTCISMPVLYIALGEALGYPIKGVNANDHFFCRWDGGGYTSNIEATSGGGNASDEQYIRDMNVTKEQIQSGAYMRSLSKREVVGNFFFARAGCFAIHGMTAQAHRDLLKVVACNPREVDAYANLAELSARRAHELGKAVDLRAVYDNLTQKDLKRQNEKLLSDLENGRLPMPGTSPLFPSALPVSGPGNLNPRPASYVDPLNPASDPLRNLPVQGAPGPYGPGPYRR